MIKRHFNYIIMWSVPVPIITKGETLNRSGKEKLRKIYTGSNKNILRKARFKLCARGAIWKQLLVQSSLAV